VEALYDEMPGEVNVDVNYILKVQDAKAVDIQKALQAAGIKITSIIEVHKDKGDESVKTS
jgi:hypothetical protein